VGFEAIGLKEEFIDYRDADAELRGLLIWDGSDGPRPGLLVVDGGGDLDDHAAGRARRLAELGLLVFACDMYGKAVMGDRERMLAVSGSWCLIATESRDAYRRASMSSFLTRLPTERSRRLAIASAAGRCSNSHGRVQSCPARSASTAPSNRPNPPAPVTCGPRCSCVTARLIRMSPPPR
jgi:dienelactone hydrolase